MRDEWCVYILRCVNGSLYTGITNNVPARIKKHIDGNGAKYTKAFPPAMLEYVEDGHDRSSASKREYEIKQLTKKQKEELVLGKR